MEIVSRQEAITAGLSRYYTGARPCKYGHVCERETRTGRCIECRRVQGSVWRRVSGFARRRNKRKRDANPEKHAARLKRWQKANPEKHGAIHKRWKKANNGAVVAMGQARRARKRGAEGRYTQSDLHVLLEKQGFSCFSADCGVSFFETKPTVDHIVPLFRGGTNWPDNIQLLCKSCNCEKHTKLMHEWKATA